MPRLVDREEIRPDLVDVEPPVASRQAGESLEAAHVANLVGFVQTQGYLEQASGATVGSTGKDGPLGPLDLVPLTQPAATRIARTRSSPQWVCLHVGRPCGVKSCDHPAQGPITRDGVADAPAGAAVFGVPRGRFGP